MTESPRPPLRQRIRTKDFWNPAIADGVRLKHYIATTSLGLVFGLIVAFWLTVGAFWVGKQTASWVQQVTAARKAFHPKTGVVVPQTPKQPISIPVGGAGLPPSAGIDFNWFTGTDTQGGLDTTTCEAHAFGKALADEVSRLNHKRVNYSKRALFDDVTNGRMIPTAPQWYAPIARDKGVVRNRYFSYGPKPIPASFPPYSAEGPPLFLNSHRRKVNVTTTFLYDSPSPGDGGLIAIKQQIARGHPVLLSFPVYRASYENSWYTGYMTSPAPGDSLYFYHGVVCVRYQNNRVFQGEKGWLLCNNSWGPKYGVDEYGNFNPDHAGYFWYSYRAVKQNSLQALYLTVHSSPPIPVGGGASAPRFVPSHAPTVKPPYNPGPVAGGGGLWVHNVHLYNDTRYADVSGVINDAAASAGINAVGLAATLETESGMNPAPTHHFPIAGAGGCDFSAGISQFTVCTIAGAPFRIGDGSLSASNINYVFNWEDTHPTTMIQFAAILLGEYKAIACVDFNPLYVAWNSGPYAAPCGSSYWWNPGGNAYGNYRNFLGWANYSTLNFSTSFRSGAPAPIPPKPRIFPRERWNRYVTRWNKQFPHHRIARVPYRYHGKAGRVAAFWAWTPGVTSRCGSPTQHEVWHFRRRFMREQFASCAIYSWPTKRGDPVKIAGKNK